MFGHGIIQLWRIESAAPEPWLAGILRVLHWGPVSFVE
ncbi:UNVERIFIED_CONTAM: hypothetical protein DES50_11295 [Williamsia faeni]